MVHFRDGDLSVAPCATLPIFSGRKQNMGNFSNNCVTFDHLMCPCWIKTLISLYINFNIINGQYFLFTEISDQIYSYILTVVEMAKYILYL